MNKEYHPYAISEDGKYGLIDTGFPEGLQQAAIVYFPNGQPEQQTEVEAKPLTNKTI